MSQYKVKSYTLVAFVPLTLYLPFLTYVALCDPISLEPIDSSMYVISMASACLAFWPADVCMATQGTERQNLGPDKLIKQK